MANVVSVILALSVVENRLATGAKFDCEAWRRSLVDYDKIIKCGTEEGRQIKCAVIRRLYIVFMYIMNLVLISVLVFFNNK